MPGQVLFEQLPDNLKKIKPKTTSKKRPATDSQSSSIISTASHSLQPAESSKGKAGQAIRPKNNTTMPPSINTAVSMAATTQAPGFENPAFQGPSNFEDSFASGFDFSPLSGTATSPDHIAAMRESGHLNMQQHMGGMANPMHRLDGVLFASGDPMAYPNQTRMDFGEHRGGFHHPGGVMPQHQNPAQFYVPNLYENIEGQLTGPLPPYMMQASNQPAFDFATQMYADPMLSVQQMHIHRPQQGPPQPQLVGSQRRRPRRQPRDPDDLLANTPWHGLWPQHAAD